MSETISRGKFGVYQALTKNLFEAAQLAAETIEGCRDLRLTQCDGLVSSITYAAVSLYFTHANAEGNLEVYTLFQEVQETVRAKSIVQRNLDIEIGGEEPILVALPLVDTYVFSQLVRGLKETLPIELRGKCRTIENGEVVKREETLTGYKQITTIVPTIVEVVINKVPERKCEHKRSIDLGGNSRLETLLTSRLIRFPGVPKTDYWV